MLNNSTIRPRVQRFALLAIDRDVRQVVAAGYSDGRKVVDHTRGQLIQVALERGQGESFMEAQADLERNMRRRGVLVWFEQLCAPHARESSLSGFGEA